ncbi:MAG: AmmeMemoRadiSam system protein B [Polyangiaceae bacterium]|nr:AmmeMemoRadiSam system protein B [Polyangiaceae bacterium]
MPLPCGAASAHFDAAQALVDYRLGKEPMKRLGYAGSRRAAWCVALIAGCLGACHRSEPEQGPVVEMQASKTQQPVQKQADKPQVPRERIREPAVAGSFYPRDPAELTSQVDGFLAQVKPLGIKGLRALVSPHAGYVYSGPIAATGYRQVVGLDVDRVVVMAPSHHVAFRGVAVPDADAFKTPLGIIPISAAAHQLAASSPFVVDSEPHREEHSLEVQLPFLQRTLKQFELVPLVFGRVDEEQVAERLKGLVSPNTVFIASSDLSHYRPYDEAKQLDQFTVDAIVRMDVQALSPNQACGHSPIVALVHLAQALGWKAQLLDYRNSGDTAGDRSRVVGYASIAFTDGK